MPQDSGERVGFRFYVDDEASKPLSKIERTYNAVVIGVGKSTSKIATSIKSYGERLDDAGTSTEKITKKNKKATSRWVDAAFALKENIFSLDKLGVSWDRFKAILTAVTAGGVIAGIFVFLKKAVTAALNLRRAVAELNEQYSMNAVESSNVSSAIISMERRFGKTREEGVRLTKTLLDLGFKPDRGFTKLALSLQEFSAATGVAEESAARFADELINVIRVPRGYIRGIGNAIKHIADQSRITADELTGMLKSLDPLITRASTFSNATRKGLTLNLLGLAGALKDAGLESDKFFSTISEIQLGMLSEAGRKATGMLAQLTGKSQQFFIDISRRDPAALMDQLAAAATRFNANTVIGRKGLIELADRFGVSFDEILKLREKAADGQSTFFRDAARDAAVAAAREEEVAVKAAKRQARLDAIFDRIKKQFDQIVLIIGGRLLKVIEKRLLPPVKEFLRLLTAEKVNKSIDTTIKFVDRMSTAFKVSGEIAHIVFSGIGLAIGRTFSAAANIFNSVMDLVEGRPQAAINLLQEAFKDEVYALKSLFFSPLEKAFSALFGGSLQETVKSGFAFIYDEFKALFVQISKMAAEFGALAMSPFAALSDKMQAKIDEFLVWLAPKVSALSKIPGIGDIAKAISEAGVGAAQRVQAREAAQRAEAARVGGAVQSVFSPTPQSVKFPSSMATTSPSLELIMRENTELLRGIKNQGRSGMSGLSPSAAKAAFMQVNK